MRCGEASIIRRAEGLVQVITQCCKRATCDECAPGYRRRVAKIMASGHPAIVFTLTAPPVEGRTPEEHGRLLLKTAASLRRYWNKHHPKQRLEWCWKIEAHKSGLPHLHILSPLKFFPLRLLKVWMFKRMRAKVAGVEKIRDPSKALNYLGKYLSKSDEKFEGIARWGRSRGYGTKTQKVEHFSELAMSPWEWSGDTSAKILHDYLMKGWRLDPTIKWCGLMRCPS